MSDDIVATITLLAIDRASETIARVGESAKAAGEESEAGFAGFLGSAGKLTGALVIILRQFSRPAAPLFISRAPMSPRFASYVSPILCSQKRNHPVIPGW
jgi:hypothetical protein